jgi:long-chain acyl-CoA synthetase
VNLKQNIMKLAQGEYVALEKIENLYSVAPYVAQVYVHGDSLQPYLIGVVVPDPVQLSALASKVFGSKVAPEDTTALEKACADARITEAVLDALTNEAKKNGLKG